MSIHGDVDIWDKQKTAHYTVNKLMMKQYLM